jgi:4-amino-4-deoxy-L-arabinose transferase-like glycosyltransferase
VSRKSKIILTGILIVSVILRLMAVFKYGNFWDDEMFSFIYSQKPWPEGLKLWFWETNPPLHLLVLKIWFFIFPATEFFARLPSVLAGSAAVYAVYRLGRDMFSEKTAYIAAFFLALHPYHIFWSATSRVYAIYMLLAICSVWFFYRIYFINNSRRDRRWGAVINLLLIFAHLSSVFLLAGEFIALIVFKGKKAAIDWIKLNIVPGLIGFVWISASLIIKTGNDLGQAWFLNIVHTFKSAINPLVNIIAGQYPIYAGTALVAAAIILLVFTTIKKIRAKDINFAVLLLIALIPIVLSFACRVWHIKFFMGVLPLIVLALSESLSIIFKKTTFAFIIIFAVCAFGLYRLWFTLPLTDWGSVAKYYSENTDDKTAFVYNNYILKSQVDRYLPEGIAQSAVALPLYENMSWDDMVVKKNYLFTLLSENKKDEWYEKNNLDDYGRIVLLQGEYDYMNKLNTVVEEHGWTLRDGPRRVRLNGNYVLYSYENN